MLILAFSRLRQQDYKHKSNLSSLAGPCSKTRRGLKLEHMLFMVRQTMLIPLWAHPVQELQTPPWFERVFI